MPKNTPTPMDLPTPTPAEQAKLEEIAAFVIENHKAFGMSRQNAESWTPARHWHTYHTHIAEGAKESSVPPGTYTLDDYFDGSWS